MSEFRNRVLGPALTQLVEELRSITGRRGTEEANAWEKSFTALARCLDSKGLQSVHLYLGDLGGLSLEYRLPAASSWCDVVLLGNNGRQPTAVIVELKHWDTRRDYALPSPGLIQRATGLVLHPSEQVKGYVNYCRNFHSAVHDREAVVEGCVVFTAAPLSSAYVDAANQQLTTDFPCFSVFGSTDAQAAITYLNQRLVNPDRDFADQFERGHYRQSRNFVRAVAATLAASPHRRLELLDEQRLGLQLALSAVRQAFADVGSGNVAKKKVVIVEGPPGSGKSAIAAKLWAEIAADHNIPAGDLAFVTTSTAQNHGMDHLFGAGAGAVKKATQFSPVTTGRFGQLRRQFPGQFVNVDDWRGNLALLRKVDPNFQTPDDGYLVSVVDEAHALINPEISDARGQFGFAVHFGPQAYHIVRGSIVTVFLLDQEQGFREQETTTREDIEKWARELGAEVLPVVSLEDRQFRCGGSTEYIAWVDGLLGGEAKAELGELADFWRARPDIELTGQRREHVAEPDISNVVAFPNPRRRFFFELVESPAELDVFLAAHHRENRSVRLVASYAREWVTKDVADPHGIPAEMHDFRLSWRNQSGQHTWSRIWNWRDAPEGYVSWIDPSPGLPMHTNPLCEVGCPYTARGFDYDYLGLLWLNDVVWRSDRWVLVAENVHEAGLRRHIQRVRHENDPGGTHHRALLRKLLQGYRILITRALRGMYVWCEDPETRDHLKECLSEL